MIYTPETKKALRLCFEAHKNQADKSGAPYVFHPFHVAEQMDEPDAVTVALLHDVAEDTNCTPDDLRAMGFSAAVTEALALLTHDKRIPYLEYVAALRANPLARKVKLADLRHNSDLSRLDSISEKDKKRVLKYKMAEAILTGDRYDRSGGCWCRSIPLDLDRRFFLSVTYTKNGISGYSVDVEDAADTHYALRPEAMERLKEFLPPAESLPEALAELLSVRGESGLYSLLQAEHIPYQSYHFD